jgi:ferredoxin
MLALQVSPDMTLLQALRHHNVEVDTSCEEGVCGACETRVLIRLTRPLGLCAERPRAREEQSHDDLRLGLARANTWNSISKCNAPLNWGLSSQE